MLQIQFPLFLSAVFFFLFLFVFIHLLIFNYWNALNFHQTLWSFTVETEKNYLISWLFSLLMLLVYTVYKYTDCRDFDFYLSSSRLTSKHVWRTYLCSQPIQEWKFSDDLLMKQMITRKKYWNIFVLWKVKKWKKKKSWSWNNNTFSATLRLQNRPQRSIIKDGRLEV